MQAKEELEAAMVWFNENWLPVLFLLNTFIPLPDISALTNVSSSFVNPTPKGLAASIVWI